ncbi:MAG TPA: response regulator [Tepidisphaeraceae bacterium]|nr:response regulator [Tepidisphaeraceae bacterium]
MVGRETEMVHTANNRLRVLLADDEERWHQTARGLLEPQGVQTVSARSGREALDILRREAIHVAVLDYRMPQIGGLQVIRLLREQRSRSPVPPAILLADDLNPQVMHEALGASIFSVLGKPVDLNVLLGTLARVLQRHYSGRWPD